MIFGRRPGAAVFATGLAAALFVASAWAQGDGALDRVMALRQAVQSSKAHFSERKFLSLLTEPIVTSGTLAYERPDRLEKTTLIPEEERLRVDGDRVSVEAAGQRHEMALSSSPELAALIECIRGTLAGDRPALERLYEVSFRGTVAKWELRLVPREARVKALVRSITINGRKSSIDTVDTEEVGGDRTILSIVEDAP